MEMQQNVAYATTAAKTSEQNKTYDTVTRISEGQNQSMEMQQNVAYTTTAAKTSEQQNTTYDTVA